MEREVEREQSGRTMMLNSFPAERSLLSPLIGEHADEVNNSDSLSEEI